MLAPFFSTGRWAGGCFEAGDELNLLPDDMRTGGHSKRL